MSAPETQAENPAEPLRSVDDAVKLIGLTAHILRTHGRNLREGVRYPAHLTPDLEKVADSLSRAFITLRDHLDPAGIKWPRTDQGVR